MKINSLLPALISLNLEKYYPENKFDFYLPLYESFAVGKEYYNLIFSSTRSTISVVLEPIGHGHKIHRLGVDAFIRTYDPILNKFVAWKRLGFTSNYNLWLTGSNFRWLNSCPVLSEQIELIYSGLIEEIG